jgi:hypothetical protein
VNNIPGIIDQWERVILSAKIAVMGWGIRKLGGNSREIGYRFANEIQPGDVVLVARGTGSTRRVVACGVVFGGHSVTGARGKWVKTMAGQKIVTPHTFGSYRFLFPFKPLGEANKSFRGVSSQRQAMYMLDPKKAADARICQWLSRELLLDDDLPGRSRAKAELSAKNKGRAEIVLPDTNDEPYFVETFAQSRIARRREAELVKDLLSWLNKGPGKIEGALRYPIPFSADKRGGQPCCDLFDPGKNLLIEAKSSVDRHHIRMAIGQLADYAHLHRENGNPDPKKAVLLPCKPDTDLSTLLRSVGIKIIWKNGNGYEY